MRKIKTGFEIIVLFIISFILKPLKKDENKILFVSDNRSELSGNLKAMYDYIPNSYNKILIFKKDKRDKMSLKQKLSTIYNYSTAKYIFIEDVVQNFSYFNFSKEQEIIQLWHALGSYKRFGASRLIKNGGSSDVTRIHRGYKKQTKAITSSDFIRKNYAEAFSMDIEKIKATGVPRTDLFFDKKYIKEKQDLVRQKYNIPKNKKVIFFAPTYRGKNLAEAHYDYDLLDIEELYKELSNDYVFLYRWHPFQNQNIKKNIVEKLNINGHDDFFIDASDYTDSNDLLLVTDVLVTDYSSIIFDYFLVNKPIVYFVPDLDDYKNNRGFFYSFEDYQYGLAAKNCSELIKDIKKNDLMENKRKCFNKKFMDACDGNSTKKTYDWIFNNK